MYIYVNFFKVAQVFLKILKIFFRGGENVAEILVFCPLYI